MPAGPVSAMRSPEPVERGIGEVQAIELDSRRCAIGIHHSLRDKVQGVGLRARRHSGAPKPSTRTCRQRTFQINRTWEAAANRYRAVIPGNCPAIPTPNSEGQSSIRGRHRIMPDAPLQGRATPWSSQARRLQRAFRGADKTVKSEDRPLRRAILRRTSKFEPDSTEEPQTVSESQ